MASFSMGSCLIIGLMLCSGMLCQNDCNYWYDQVPKSSNQTNCSTRTGENIIITCSVYHPCGNISIDWYKSVAEGEGDIWDRGERITTSGRHTLIPLTRTNAMATNSRNFDNTCCFASSGITIYPFTQDEAGYYWCQIVTPNGRRLQNSTYGYISLHPETDSNIQPCRGADPYINHLNPPICAIDRTYCSTSKRRTCDSNSMNSTSMMPSHSTSNCDTTGENTNQIPSTFPESTDHSSTTAMPISSKSDMLWVYLLMVVVIITLVIAFMVCFIIFYRKYRTLQKRATGNTTGEGATSCRRARSHVKLHKNISYNKVILKENNELLNTTTSAVQSSQINTELDTSPEENHQGKVNDSPQVNNEPPEYATVNKLKKTKLENTQQPTIGGSLDYDEPTLGHREGHKSKQKPSASGSVDYAVPTLGDGCKSVTAEKQRAVSTFEAPSHPPPVYSYAKVPKKSQPVPAQAAGSTQQEALSTVDKRSPTPEYAAVRDSTRFSVDYTEKEAKEHEQNSIYYHSLENPNECSTVETDNHYHSLENPNECSTVDANTFEDDGGGDVFDSDIYTAPYMLDTEAGTVSMSDKFYGQESEEGGIDDHHYHSLENPIESDAA